MRNPASVLVVDDEPLARRRLLRLLAGRIDAEVVGEAKTGREAIDKIAELAPDLLFLDVQMPDGSGLRVLERVGLDAVGAVVFVTAYDRFALQAFDLHAVDYLLKPFSDARFEQALERALGRLRRSDAERVAERLAAVLDDFRAAGRGPGPPPPAADPAPRSTLTVKVGGTVRILRPAEIDWIEAAGSYVRLHLRRGTCLVRETMDSVVSRLPGDDFLRIHRSSAVRLDRVVEVQPLTHREQILVLRDGTRLKLSRTYRDAFEKSLGFWPRFRAASPRGSAVSLHRPWSGSERSVRWPPQSDLAPAGSRGIHRGPTKEPSR